jgi:ribosome biogenesis GTPase A
LNKIDLLEEKTTEQIKNFYRYPFINRIQSVAISAKNKNNLGLLLKEAMG